MGSLVIFLHHFVMMRLLIFLLLRVCAIVIPWNYPLMMLAWKTAACLAAGNTVVLKPAQVSLVSFKHRSEHRKVADVGACFQVTPLTALKFAELASRAGLPKGVINILPGSGRKTVKQHSPAWP